MGCSRLTIIVLLIGFMGIGIMYLFDPTRSFPTVKIQVTLKPGENFTLGIPKYNGLQWLAGAWADPMLWIETDVKDFAIDRVEALVPDTILGFFPMFNDKNDDVDNVV